MVSLAKVPQHIAIIMDGNGRWAEQRNLCRAEGHKAGAVSVRRTVEECRRLGVRYLTLYSFSSENWNRAKDEVSGLMDLFRQYLESELDGLIENGIRLRAIGDIGRLPFGVRRVLARDIKRTENNTGLDLVLAVSYGARDEIVAATKAIAKRVKTGEIKIEDINAEMFSSSLWTNGIPDPDLLIRTSGEMRISNFLLWQIAYSELMVLDKLWPDFDEDTLHSCIEKYNLRERRFGLSGAQLRAQANEAK